MKGQTGLEVIIDTLDKQLELLYNNSTIEGREQRIKEKQELREHLLKEIENINKKDEKEKSSKVTT